MLELIERLAVYIHPQERANFVLFGSAAISLRGIRLGRPINDLDVFVSEETFNSLKVRFSEQSKHGKDGPVPFFCPAAEIEILKSFPGVQFDAVRQNAAVIDKSLGFPVGSIDDLCAWKRAQGRPKDLIDLEAIEEQRT